MKFNTMTLNSSISNPSCNNEFEPFLFTHHTAPMLIVDPSSGQILDANTSAVEFYGWSQNQLQSMRIQEINTLSEEQVEEEMEKARTLQRNYFDFKHRIAKGSIRHVRVFSTKFDFEGRNLLHSIVTDITEQKTAEGLLIQNERMLTDLIEQSPVIYELYDSSGLQIKVNSAWEKLWCIPREDCLGKYNILFDSQIRENGWLPYLEKAFAGEISYPPEVEYDYSQTPSTQGEGKKKWVSTVAYPIKDDSGEVTNVVVLHEDITERKKMQDSLKESEYKFRRIFESVHDGIFQTTIDGRFLGLNPSFATTFGYASMDEMINLTQGNISNVYANAEDRSAILSQLMENGEFRDHEILGRKKDGTHIWGSVNEYAVKNESGEILFFEGTVTDISERKAAEEKLRRSEAKFRAIVENSFDGILFSDADASITYRSPSFSRINGFTNEERLGHSIFETLHPEDQQMLRERWNSMIVNPGWVLKAEYRIRHKNGTWRWVDTTAQNLLQNPDVSSIVITSRDVTNNKLAEQALHKSQATLQAVIDSTFDLIWSVDATDFGLLSWNDAYVKYNSEQRGIELKVGMRPCDLFPPGSSYIQEWENYYSQALQKGSFSTEYTVFAGTRTLDLNLNPLRQGTKIFSISVFGKDITERKQAENALKESEKKFRYLFDSLPICVGITKIDTGKFLELNETSVAFTGYDIDTLNETGAANSYANPSDRDQIIQILKQKGNVDNFETVMRRRNGTLYNALVNAKIIQLNGENVLLSNIQDITERKKTEEALRNSQRFESLGLMAGGIAHDFNNILGGIVGYADMSKDCVPPDSRISTYLDKILTSADRAKNLVNQILSFSRQRTDSLNPMYIRPIVNEVIELLRATLPSSIELKCDIAKDSRPVHANSTRIHEVIMDLCVNAAYAMKNKGTLEISHKELTLESELVGKAGIILPGFYSVISVKDTGSGIPPEILSKIFEPYFTTKPFGEGTGLGLAVVLGIVQSHQGNITVESIVGKGTEFKLYLPKSDDDPVGDERDESKIRGGKERILFIDDEIVLCEMVRDMLTSLGYKVTAFSDSFKALKEVKDVLNDYDLVITDHTMPKITGFELSKEFLNLRKDLPIILCTGYSKDLDESTILGAGISALCLKPVRKADIAKKIRMVLDKKSGDV